MSIVVDYTPMGAVGQMATQAGIGEANVRAFQQQMAMAQLAQQDEAQRRALQAQLYGQAQQNQVHAWQQMQNQAFQAQMQGNQYAQQNAYQQQGYQNNLNLARQQAIGPILNRQMHDIETAERAGWGYSPTQQDQINKLDASFDKLSSDPAVSPQQLASAQMQYYQQRTRIQPKAPPPVSFKEEAAKSIADLADVTGDESFRGMIISRNREYQIHDSPMMKNDLAMQQAQQKQAVAVAKAQQDANIKNAKAQQDLELNAIKMEQAKADKAEAAYYQMRDKIFQLHKDGPPKAQIGQDQATVSAEHKKMIQEREQELLDQYRRLHGGDLVNPDLRAKVGLGERPQYPRWFDRPAVWDQGQGAPPAPGAPPAAAPGAAAPAPQVPAAPAAPVALKDVQSTMRMMDPKQADMFDTLPPEIQQQLAGQNGEALMKQAEQVKKVLPFAKAKAELGKKEIELKHNGPPPPGSPDAQAWRHYQETLDLARRFGV